MIKPKSYRSPDEKRKTQKFLKPKTSRANNAFKK